MFGWLDEALAELRTLDLRRTGPDAALYSTDLLEEEYGELVAFVPGEPRAAPPGRVERVQLPRVEYAVAVHAGAVDDIDRTYAVLGAVVAERRIGVHGPIREDYVIGAFDTHDETKHRTEIGWPVFQTAPAA
jgi:effector-binding domain-containing protein